MKFFCGTDIIEIDRIKNSIERRKEFINKIYTKKEIEYCESKGKSKYQHYAARFAGKEALFKATSSMMKSKYEKKWTDVEILNDSNGRPYINFLEDNVNLQCDISLSHCKQYATAVVIVGGDNESI